MTTAEIVSLLVSSISLLVVLVRPPVIMKSSGRETIGGYLDGIRLQIQRLSDEIHLSNQLLRNSDARARQDALLGRK